MFCILLVFGFFLVTRELYVFRYFPELTVSEMRFGC